MKYSTPETFIQIHYHNHPGGVTTVMHRYAEVFSRLSSSPKKRTVIICHKTDSKTLNPGVEIISIRDCDYTTFNSKKSFLSHKAKLFGSLEEFIKSKDLPRPVCVVGHNLSLGKNIALSAAFTDLAESLKNDRDVRFYSVIHDLAEEGRTDLMHHLRYLISLNIDVWSCFYQTNCAVTYVALNKRNYALFKSMGLSVRLLPNPLIVKESFGSLSKRERVEITGTLSLLAKSDNVPFFTSKKTLFYPARVIPRKNILEAVITACLMYDANLLIGRCGASKQDRKLYNRLKKMAQKYRLPILLDVERIRTGVPAKLLRNKTVFEVVYDYADACLTTSLAEGFGYALYEPWLHNKPLIGRLPLGISEKEIINLTHLYTSFRIPVSYTNSDTLYRLYCKKIVSTYGLENMPVDLKTIKNEFRKAFVRNGCVDFGALSLDMQMKAIQRIFSNRKTRNNAQKDLIKANELFHKAVGSDTPIRASYIKAKRNHLMKRLHGRAYDKKFRECFFNKYFHFKAEGVYFKNRSFINYFSSLDSFRLLMSNGE